MDGRWSGTVAVTGASGFVGSHLVDRLLTDGARVRCLVRETSQLRWVDPGRVEVARVDFASPRSLAEAIDGCPTVLHVAGAVRARDEAGYRRANVEVTRDLVRACGDTGAARARFVLVSSLAAAGPSQPGRPRDENDPPAPASPYGRSKLDGEIALREAAGNAIPWSVVRPPVVYGPRDVAFLKLLRMARSGWVARVGGPRRPVAIVHVSDLVEAIVRCAREPNAVGRFYFTAHARFTDFEEIAATAARVFGRRRVRWVTVPRLLVGTVGRVAAITSALRNRPNPLPADRLQDLLAPAWCCSSARARTELDWQAQIDLEPGFADAIAWYRDEGWL